MPSDDRTSHEAAACRIQLDGMQEGVCLCDQPETDSTGVKTGAATTASVAPMAIPRSAACSAAMSLIPSPQ